MHGQVPRYLSDHMTPASEVASQQTDASLSYLVVDSTHTAVEQILIACPTVWTSFLLVEFRDLMCGFDSFKLFAKTILLSLY